MTLKYKIIEVYPSEHSIVVRYYSDVVTEKMLATQVDPVSGAILRGRTDFNINLPIPAPTGKALEDLILDRAPTEFLDLHEAIVNPSVDTSLSGLLPLVGKENRVTPEVLRSRAADRNAGGAGNSETASTTRNITVPINKVRL